MARFTCSRISVGSLLLALAIQVVPATRFAVSSITILGSAGDNRACLGVQITQQHVLTTATCAKYKGPLKSAFFVEPAWYEAQTTTTELSQTGKTKLLLSKRRAIADISIHPRFALRKTDKLKDRLLYDVAVVWLKHARPESLARNMAVPSGMAFPRPEAKYVSEALLTIDWMTLTLGVTERVVYMPNSQCFFPAINYSSLTEQPICVLPVVDLKMHDTVVDLTDSWSFLVRATSDDRDWILGFGDSSELFDTFFRGFSWIGTDAISKWLTADRFPGLQRATPSCK